MVYVKMFGDWEVFSYGKKIEHFTSKKALKILFYILLENTSRVSFAEISKHFWNGLNSNYARKNLNAQLYYIRKDLGISNKHLGSERDYVYINKYIFDSDYNQFMLCVEKINQKENIERIKSIYKGELLVGLNDSWIEKYRALTKKLHEKALFNNFTGTMELLKSGITNGSSLLKENVEVIVKAKTILEQQTLTREKYFVPVIISTMSTANGSFGGKNNNNNKEDSKNKILPINMGVIRKGDIIIDLEDKKILLLEKGRKEKDEEVIKGFMKRFFLTRSQIEVPKETELLATLNNVIKNLTEPLENH